MVAIRRDELHIRELASGGRLTIPVFRAGQADARPQVYVQANIHGPEIAGIGAAHFLLDALADLPQLNGHVVVVPSVNPVGLNSKINGMQVGYADLNETQVGNFNRIYHRLYVETAQGDESWQVDLGALAAGLADAPVPQLREALRAGLRAAVASRRGPSPDYGLSHGQRLAALIQTMAVEADILLDLHTAGRAAHHLFTFAACAEAAPMLGLPFTILLDDSFSGVLDEAFLQPWLRLVALLNERGRAVRLADFGLEAYTLELGSADTLSRAAARQDAERVLNFLRWRGVVPGEARAYPGDYIACEHDDYRRYRATAGGLLLWHKSPGDAVRAGETLATILRPYARGLPGEALEVPILAHSDGVMINHVESHVVHEGMGVCSVMTNTRPILG